MHSTIQTSAKWGLFIGLANLVWLYLAYFIGLHTNGIMVFQIFMLVWLALTVTGFIFALRAVTHTNPVIGYLRGVGAGAVSALVSAIVAVIAQVGYFTIVHPAWPDVMAQQTADHFTAQGRTPEQVEQMVLQSRRSFTLSNYAISSAAAALILGIMLSAIVMVFLRRRAN